MNGNQQTWKVYSTRSSTLNEDILEVVQYCRTHYRNITAPMPEISRDVEGDYFEACYAYNELARITGDHIEFIYRQSPTGSIVATAWSYTDATCAHYLPDLTKAIELKMYSEIRAGKYFPPNFYHKDDALTEEERRLNLRVNPQ